MKPSIRKRIYIIASVILLIAGISVYYIYRENRSAHSVLAQAFGLVEVNPRKALADVDRIDRRFLSEGNYMLCDLLKASAYVNMQEFVVSDSLLNFVSPYFKYKGDSLRLAQIYCYKGEIARHSNFLLEAIEYFTLCIQYNNDTHDLHIMNYYLNNFKGQTYHIKQMKEKEQDARLEALKLAKMLKNKDFMQEAYSGLAQCYVGMKDSVRTIPLLKEAISKGFSGSLQARFLFSLSEQYANALQPDSALLYARQIPHLYQDSIDYLLGKINFNLHQTDSARYYLNKSCGSTNPRLGFKAYRQLLDLNVRTGSMKGVADCLAKLDHYQAQVDSIEMKETLSRIEDVERLRKTIRDTEAQEVDYYKYWIFYFWIMVAAFLCILILLIVSVSLQRKKRNLQLKRQQARLDALKMQIDPHFIFNNLSILLDLVETNDQTAPNYVRSLSKVYRHIVSNVDKNLSSVEDELTCLDNYIFLLKIRFGNAIQINLLVEDEIKGRRIPPIVLQMLLENAIKHNRASEESPLFIRIYSVGDKLVVENAKKLISVSTSTHHIGLRNIKERYSLIGAPAPEIYEDDEIYRVTLSTL